MTSIDKISEITEGLITKYTIQLFKLKGNEFCPFGTGILLNFNGTFWLITASHITENQEDDELYFQYEPNQFLSIAGEFGESNLKINNKIDFATIRLKNECVKRLNRIKNFLDLNETGRIQDQFEKQTLVACGFPAKLLDNSTSVIVSHGEYIITTTANEKPYK
jgi:hypothetical protein